MKDEIVDDEKERLIRLLSEAKANDEIFAKLMEEYLLSRRINRVVVVEDGEEVERFLTPPSSLTDIAAFMAAQQQQRNVSSKQPSVSINSSSETNQDTDATFERGAETSRLSRKKRRSSVEDDQEAVVSTRLDIDMI